tara:strand:- start:328 stop:1020 length:693 start_codon:yes stop_codon:yes gene_type:complete
MTASLLLLSLSSLADNKIILENVQTGDNFNLQITQAGVNNKIDCYYVSSCDIDGSNVSLHFEQWNTSGTENKIQIWHLDGNSNQIRWGQGAALSSSSDTTFNYDGSEGGGHYARLDIHGNSNSIIGFQKNDGSTTGHVFTSLIWSDNNSVWAGQMGNGKKTLHIHTYNDGNNITSRQIGNGAEHNASIVLNGSYPTSINLLQQGTTTQNYSISQNCQTSGGCSVGVTQGN